MSEHQIVGYGPESNLHKLNAINNAAAPVFLIKTPVIITMIKNNNLNLKLLELLSQVILFLIF